MSYGLSDADRRWFQEQLKEVSAEIRRQWDFSNNLNTELKLHIQESRSTHNIPCTAAQTTVKLHVDEFHNPVKKVKTLGIFAGTAAGIGEAIHWLHKIFEK